MTNKWFKFYGQDYLTDPKMLSLSPTEKAIWVTLLCLAMSSDGVIKFIDVDKIRILTGIQINSPEWYATNKILEKFETLSMITHDNDTITLSHFVSRQETMLSGYERVKRHREKVKTKSISSNKNEAKNDNNDNVINDNARIDKIRIDKNNNILSDKPKVSSPIRIKLYERKPQDTWTQLQRITYHLEDKLQTKIVTWGKQAKALEMMLKAGFNESQILKTIDYMATQDEFFSDKGFDLMTVANNISRYKAQARKQI